MKGTGSYFFCHRAKRECFKELPSSQCDARAVILCVISFLFKYDWSVIVGVASFELSSSEWLLDENTDERSLSGSIPRSAIELFS